MDKQSLEIRTRQWYEIILEANSSSLSKKEWCRQNSISLKSFYYWQRKLRQKEAEKLRDVTPAALTCLNETSAHSLSANTPVETEERIREHEERMRDNMRLLEFERSSAARSRDYQRIQDKLETAQEELSKSLKLCKKLQE